MRAFIHTLLILPRAAKILFALSVGSLLFAFTMQYGVGLRPCVLCLWQRYPYVASAVILGAVLVWRPYGRHSCVLLALCSLIYLIGMGLGVFHSGVELHWWVGTAGCAVEPLHGSSASDMREALLHTLAPRCDEIAWTIFGLSMANLNIAWSLGLAFFAAAAAAANTRPALR